MEISFPSADKSFDLYGDLYLPSTNDDQPEGGGQTNKNKIPAVVIVAGSGPIDRNGNAVGNLLARLNLNTSNRFAEYMMERCRTTTTNTSSGGRGGGVAVLTYDKRGVGKSIKVGEKDWYYRAGMMDLVSDAVEAVRFVQSHPQIDPQSVAVMGHSEGSLILPLICQELKKPTDLEHNNLKGAIFLAGFGENLFDAIRFQQQNVLKEVETMPGLKGWFMRKVITKEKVEKQHQDLMQKIHATKHHHNNDNDNDLDHNNKEEDEYVSLYCGIAKVPSKWFREHETYKVQETLAREMTHNCHCLAITGAKDVQVRHEFCVPETAKALVPNAASIESHILPNMTHALRSIDQGTKASILNLKKDYAHQGTLPLDAELLDLIGNWCDRILLNNK